VRLAPQGLETVEGVVDYLRPNFTGIRTADALYCFFGRNAFGGPVALTIHLFGNGVDSATIKDSWQQYLNSTLA